MEHVEREAPSKFLLGVRAGEVVPAPEEIPRMVELDTMQLGELVLLIARSESVVDGSHRKNRSHRNTTSGELIVFSDNRVKDGRVEITHDIADSEEDGVGECQVVYGIRCLQGPRSSHVDREVLVDKEQRRALLRIFAFVPFHVAQSLTV